METRTFAGEVQVRALEDGPTTLEGYGAVFYNASDRGTEFELWPGTVERLDSTVFDRALREDDVKSLFNHDPNFVLGRKESETLALQVDKRGLHYIANPPQTSLIADQVIEPIRRGDVTGSSFMFRVLDEEWSKETRDDNQINVRTLKDVQLIEVGPVTFPAYKGTSTDAREARASFDKWQEQQQPEPEPPKASMAALKAKL